MTYSLFSRFPKIAVPVVLLLYPLVSSYTSFVLAEIYSFDDVSLSSSRLVVDGVELLICVDSTLSNVGTVVTSFDVAVMVTRVLTAFVVSTGSTLVLVVATGSLTAFVVVTKSTSPVVAATRLFTPFVVVKVEPNHTPTYFIKFLNYIYTGNTKI